MLDEKEALRDPSGNPVEDSVAVSMQMRCYVMASKLDKVAWDLTHACLNKKNTTKDEMIKTMNEACGVLVEIRKELLG